MRGDSRTIMQELGRSCRRNQESRGNWLVCHPLLMTSAAWLVDLEDARAAGAYRACAALVRPRGGGCRRACLLALLGCPLVNTCAGCDHCTPEVAALPSARYELVDATSGALALLRELVSTTASGDKAWFVKFLREGTWRASCRTVAEANALFLYLFTEGFLDLAKETVGSVGGQGRALHVTVARERAAAVLSLDVAVRVWCLSEPQDLVAH